MRHVIPEVPPQLERRHDPETMSYRPGQTRAVTTDRGEFAFREHAVKPERPEKPWTPRKDR